MKRHQGVGLAVALSAVISGGSAVQAQAVNDDSQAQVVLETHEQRPWVLPNTLERIAISDPDVADVITLKQRGQVLLVGKKAGQTVLLLWQRGQAQPQRVSVLVRGAVQGPLEDGSGLKITQQDDAALIHGNTPSLLAHQQAVSAAGTNSKAQVSDTSTVDSGGVVQVDVKVVEFDKTVMSSLGLNLARANGGFSFGTFSPSSLTSYTVNSTTSSGTSSTLGSSMFQSTSPISSAFNLVFGSNSWFGDLSILQSNGLARVLAEPTLTALSGQSANFLAGGELPIPEPQGLGTVAVVYKTYGVGLTLTPTVLSPDRIALKVAPEASELDYTNELTIDGTSVPAITTRRADTTVELGDGETFLIGGLVSQDITSQMSKIPLLGDIPVLGAFFRDMQYSKQEKELVIMVTPHLVHAMGRGAKLPLPGDREVKGSGPVWGAALLNPAGSDQLPGFSR